MSRMQQVFDAAVDRFQKGFHQSGNCYTCILGTLADQGLITRQEWNEASDGMHGEFGKFLKQLETVYEGWTTQFIDRGISLLSDSDIWIGASTIAKWNKEQQVAWYNTYLKQIAKIHGLEMVDKDIKLEIDTILEVA